MIAVFYTRKEVADYFNVSLWTVDSWVKSKKIECFKVQNIVRFSKKQLNEFIEKNIS